MLCIKRAALLLVLTLAAGCNGTLTNLGSGPLATPTPAASHLYVADPIAGHALLQFALPLTSTSTPSATMTNVTRNFGVAANSSAVAVSDLTGVRIVTQPVSSSSTVSATLPGSAIYTPAFGSSGQLYTLSSSSGSKVNIYTPPFSNSSVASSTITYTIGTSEVAVDGNGNVYVNNHSSGISAATSAGTVFATTTVSGRFYRGIAATSTQLFACDVSASVGTDGGVDVFTLPLTNSSAPAFTIKNGINGPEGCAVDSSGNLYVGNVDTAQITVYAPPFSASSAPAVTLTVGSPATLFVGGIGVGP